MATLNEYIAAAQQRQAAAEAEQRRQYEERERTRIEALLQQVSENFDRDFSAGLRAVLAARPAMNENKQRAYMHVEHDGMHIALQSFSSTGGGHHWDMWRVAVPGVIKQVAMHNQQARDDALVLALAEFFDAESAKARNDHDQP